VEGDKRIPELLAQQTVVGPCLTLLMIDMVAGVGAIAAYSPPVLLAKHQQELLLVVVVVVDQVVLARGIQAVLVVVQQVNKVLVHTIVNQHMGVAGVLKVQVAHKHRV
jgi:hypothetical protein